MLTAKELSSIRKNLPTGGYQKVAAVSGYDSSTVGKCLRDPKHFNETIINSALMLIEEHKTKLAELKQRVKDVTKKEVNK